MLPRASSVRHFCLYTINTSEHETDVMLQLITTGLCLIGSRQQTSLITCLQEIGSQKGRVIFNHVNVMTCDLWFPSLKWDISVAAVSTFNTVGLFKPPPRFYYSNVFLNDFYFPGKQLLVCNNDNVDFPICLFPHLVLPSLLLSSFLMLCPSYYLPLYTNSHTQTYCMQPETDIKSNDY